MNFDESYSLLIFRIYNIDDFDVLLIILFLFFFSILGLLNSECHSAAMYGPILIISLELEGEERVVSGSLHTPHSIWLHLILSSL